MPGFDQQRLFARPTRIRFWERRFITSDEPDTVLRELFDDDGLIGRERYDPQTGTWVDHHSIGHTGIGGSADWDTDARKEAADTYGVCCVRRGRCRKRNPQVADTGGSW